MQDSAYEYLRALHRVKTDDCNCPVCETRRTIKLSLLKTTIPIELHNDAVCQISIGLLIEGMALARNPERFIQVVTEKLRNAHARMEQHKAAKH